MTSHKSVVLLLLLSSVFFAFDFTPYIMANETNVSITYSNFTSGTDSYSIVAFNSVDTFVLKNGEILTNESELTSVVYSYYQTLYYPTQTEIDDLRAAITEFNDSRNDGYDFKNKEEYSCRDDVLLSNGKITIYDDPVVCIDEESCTTNAMLLYSVYGSGLGLGSADYLVDPLVEFTPSSLKMDWYISNYTYMLDNLSPENAATSIQYISETATELRSLSENVEYTIFRTPKLNDSDDRADCMYTCLAICPSFDLDQDAADSIASKASALATKLSPLTNSASSILTIYDRTLSRVDYAETTAIADAYWESFKPLNQSGTATISGATDILTHVLNPTLSAKLSELQVLHSSIPLSISQKNFTNLDYDIATYQSLVSTVSNLTNETFDQYNRTLTIKNNENLLLLVLETRDLDPVTISSLELLKAQSDDLNIQFRDGLTVDELAALEGNYTELNDAAEDLLQNEGETPSKKAASMFRGLARRLNAGIAAFADNTGILQSSEIPENSLILGAFSLLTFLSFSSIVILAFLYLFALNHFTVPKTPHIIGVALLSLLAILLLFGGFLFIFLDKTSTDATFTEFLADFESKGSASILVDMRNATVSDADAMQECATKFADALSAQNKTWIVYSLASGACTIEYPDGTSLSSTISECESYASDADSSFIFGYSDTDSIDFSIIYESEARINADQTYYDSCPLVVMFG